MKKNIHIAFIVSSLFLILFSYNNCEGGKKSNNDTGVAVIGDGGKLSPGVDDGVDLSGSSDQRLGKTTDDLVGESTNYEAGPSEVESSFFSVMTGEGLLNSYSTITGIPILYEDNTGESPVLVENTEFFSKWMYHPFKYSYYNSVKSNLPIEPSLDKFNSSSFNSITSLASSFCEEVFVGTHPVSGLEYKDMIPNLDLSNVDPQEEDITLFVDRLFSWLIPHVVVDERGKGVIRSGVVEKVDSYSNFKNSGIEKHTFFNFAGLNFRFFGDPVSEIPDAITFKESFFLSYFIMPQDSSTGFVNPTGYHDQQLLELHSEYGDFEIIHTFNGHQIDARINTYNSSLSRHRSASFVINDSAKNQLKRKAYNIVIEYVADPSIGDKVSMGNDFNVYINGEKTNLVSEPNDHWYDFYEGIDKRFDKSTVFFGSVKEDEGEFVSVDSHIFIRNDSRLSMGNIEFFKGTYEDVIKNAPEEAREFLFDEDGDFTFARTVSDVALRGASIFFGRLATEVEDERILYFKTSASSFHRSKTYGSSSQSITSSGLNIKKYENLSWFLLSPQHYNHSFDFNAYDAQVIFPKPFLDIAPLMCTAVMSSGYFLFN